MDELLPGVDGDRTPLPVLACPLSVDLRVADEVVLPGVNLGMRLGVFESETNARIDKVRVARLGLRLEDLKSKNYGSYLQARGWWGESILAVGGQGLWKTNAAEYVHS